MEKPYIVKAIDGEDKLYLCDNLQDDNPILQQISPGAIWLKPGDELTEEEVQFDREFCPSDKLEAYMCPKHHQHTRVVAVRCDQCLTFH